MTKVPQALATLSKNLALKQELKRYENALKKLDEIYICECTRATKDAYKNGIYTKICKR